jgi:hypothetical protein
MGTLDGFLIAFGLGVTESEGFVTGSFLSNGTYEEASAQLVVSGIAASDVPEPAIWAMMVGGFGLIGCMMRGRRRTLRGSLSVHGKHSRAAA